MGRASVLGNSQWLRAGVALLGLLMAALLTLLCAQAAGVWRVPGVRVAGHALRGTDELARQARAWNEQSLRLQLGYHVFQPSHAELGWTLEVADAERELRALGRSENPLLALRALWIGVFGPGHELHWRPRLHDAAALDRYLEQLRGQIDRLPFPGSYAPDGTPIDGLPGEALDTAAARGAIGRALQRGDAMLELATLVTAPPRIYRRYERLGRDSAGELLMFAQDTRYRAGTGRAINIELAARKLDGAVIVPGGVLSFNELVGRRTAARGFAPALELVRGEVAQGIGGGVCQVAGTLHAAAFYAGLAVEEYHAHSRLSHFAYLQPGLDAMVAWPDHVTELRDTKDMRLRNPYPFPIAIAASTERDGDGQVLRIALYGAAKPFRVDYAFDVVSRTPASELRRVDSTLARGETRLQQDALEGLTIARRRTIYTPTQRFEEETRVVYPPTPRILLVSK